MTRQSLSWLPWVALILIAGGIYLMSTAAFGSDETAQIFGSYNHIVRKAAHFTEYAVLFAVANWVLNFAMRGRYAFTTAVFTLVCCAVYALSDEWHQAFVPGRTASPNDVLLDVSGAFFAFACWLVYKLITRKRSR